MAASKGKTLGGRIRAVRVAWGITQEQLAKELHCTQTSVSLWERDDIVPQGTTLVALCALFGCTVKALTTGRKWKVPDRPLPPFLSVFEDLFG